MKIRILDPACGSGSFLIGAFDYLLEHHRQFYSEHRGEKKYKADWYETPEGEVCLTIQKKRDILKNNIFGVDIDREATEVAIMSLYLKLLEEGFDKGEAQLFVGTLLPDMTGNIKCGNSLIGSDYYEGRDLKLFSDEEFKSVNAFDWDGKNGFPEIMKAGGFDCVIGNPPYVRQEMLSEYKEYFQSHFKVYHGVADLYAYFIERGISLLKSGGRFSYIVANKWMRANYGGPLREHLLKSGIAEIIDFGDLQVFQDATTYPCIITVVKGSSGVFNASKVGDLDFSDLRTYLDGRRFIVSTASLNDEGWSLSDKRTTNLLNKIKSLGIPLGEYIGGNTYRGILTGLDAAFVISGEEKNKLMGDTLQYKKIIKPYIEGKDIARYKKIIPRKHLIFMPKGWTNLICKDNKPWSWLEENFRNIADHLKPFELKAKTRCDQGDYWWELRSCDYYTELEKPKIVYNKFQVKPNFTYDPDGFYYNTAIFSIPTNNLCILGILNSKLGWFLISNYCTQIQGGYQLIWDYFKNIPVPKLDVNKEHQQKVHNLVIQIIEVNSTIGKTNSETELSSLRHKADLLDRQIDALVYELYGLTEEEIGIVEG